MIWFAGVAAAQSVVFDLNDQEAQQLGLDAAQIEDELGGALGDQLNLVDTAGYLASFAGADAIALKGMGVDYASNPRKFTLGATVGSAVADVPLTFVRSPTTLPDGGYAFMASAHAGLNLGALTPSDDWLDRVIVYGNGMKFSPPGNRNFQASLYNFGGHLQVKVVGPFDLKAVEWGGFDVTVGYEKSFYQLELNRALPLTHSVAPAKFTWTANGNYQMSAVADTVPLELSTNVRLLMLTAFGGGAVDVNGATATSTASLAGPVDAEVAGESANLGTASVSLEGTGDAARLVPRAFVGAQLGFGPAKLYGQLNVASSQTYGGFLGVRLAM
ncbi:MAG: hypothetical protein ABMA64_08270 [Myxococcota bacterium]